MRPNNQKTDYNPSYILILALAYSLLLCAVETTVYIMVVLVLVLVLVLLLLVIIFFRMKQIVYVVALFPPGVMPQKPVIPLLLRLLRKRNYLTIEKLRQRSLHQHSNGQQVQVVREGWRAYADEIIGKDHCSPVVNNTSESRENCPVSVDRPQLKRVHWWDGYPTARDSKVAGDIRADDLRRVGIDASILGPPGPIGIGSIRGVHSDIESMPVGSINRGYCDIERVAVSYMAKMDKKRPSQRHKRSRRSDLKSAIRNELLDLKYMISR